MKVIRHETIGYHITIGAKIGPGFAQKIIIVLLFIEEKLAINTTVIDMVYLLWNGCHTGEVLCQRVKTVSRLFKIKGL